MQFLRRAGERGTADHGWLSSHHTFSFAEYHDPEFMGFGPLRVINDDTVIGGAGFGRHPHKDMEIISYVLEGALEHKDSLGNGSVMVAGDVQLMRAGTGIVHSEYNHSPDEAVHFLQIWIIPNQRGLAPGYAQRHFGAERHDQLRLVASQDGREDSLQLAQDLDLYAMVLTPENRIEHELLPDRQAWIQVAEGSLLFGDVQLEAGDGLAVVDEPRLTFETRQSANVLVFDMKRIPQPQGDRTS